LRSVRSSSHDDRLEDPSEAAEEVWRDSDRSRVIEYLSREGVGHGEVGNWPAWHVWPCVAVWAIESVKSPPSARHKTVKSSGDFNLR
jgi:hypothetical protein